MAGVGDRLCDVEQQKIIEKHVRVGGQRGRRPVLLAVAHIPVGQDCPSDAEGNRAKLFIDRERRLLIPEVADIVDALQSADCSSRTLVCSGRPTQSIRGGGCPTKAPGTRNWQRFGDHRRTASPCRDRARARIELDDDAKHVVVEEQILKFPHDPAVNEPGEDERIGAHPREDAEGAVRRGCSFFVTDKETKRLSVRQRASAALDGLAVCRAALKARQTGN